MDLDLQRERERERLILNDVTLFYEVRSVEVTSYLCMCVCVGGDEISPSLLNLESLAKISGSRPYWAWWLLQCKDCVGHSMAVKFHLGWLKCIYSRCSVYIVLCSCIHVTVWGVLSQWLNAFHSVLVEYLHVYGLLSSQQQSNLKLVTITTASLHLRKTLFTLWHYIPLSAFHYNLRPLSTRSISGNKMALFLTSLASVGQNQTQRAY